MPEQHIYDSNEYPFPSQYLDVNAHKLHFIDTGGKGEPILFVDSTPSWSFDFRHIIKYLSPAYSLVRFG